MSSFQDPTPAQEEFTSLVRNTNGERSPRRHPDDESDSDTAAHSDRDEEDRFRDAQIEAAMRMPTMDGLGDSSPATGLKLPPAAFDSGRSTGVKGVIADARNYESARRSKWKNRARAVRRSVFGVEGGKTASRASVENSEEEQADSSDEESFLQQWRESRLQELEREARSGIRARRTSPSSRIYGRLDSVDALGYLDAIEKVGRDTVVVVFVYDHECLVSSTVESALRSLVSSYPAVHFIKIHYEDIELDNAGVPAILAYKNQGDLFANLTGLIEMIPDDEAFGSDSLLEMFQKHHIL